MQTHPLPSGTEPLFGADRDERERLARELAELLTHAAYARLA